MLCTALRGACWLLMLLAASATGPLCAEWIGALAASETCEETVEGDVELEFVLSGRQISRRDDSSTPLPAVALHAGRDQSHDSCTDHPAGHRLSNGLCAPLRC